MKKPGTAQSFDEVGYRICWIIACMSWVHSQPEAGVLLCGVSFVVVVLDVRHFTDWLIAVFSVLLFNHIFQ